MYFRGYLLHQWHFGYHYELLFIPKESFRNLSISITFVNY